MATAEILTIGTELLLGEIIDTNSRYIARTLRDHGVNIFYLSTVGDNAERIAEALRYGLTRSQVIITTGGLGPTIDDPTREAVALAVGVQTEFREELWQQVQDRFARFGRKPTENNKRQAYVPAGAIAIENPVGTAPAFIVETDGRVIISLPGVPREMEHLMQNAVIPYLKKHFNLSGIIKARILRTAGAGESAIDQQIADLELLTNPTVGLSAHAGSVDIRITAKAENEAEADALIAPVEAQMHERLGDWIYGADEDTLENVALRHLENLDWNLAVVEAGLGGRLSQRLAETSQENFLGGEVLAGQPKLDTLTEATRKFRFARQADLCLGISLERGEEKQTLQMVILSPIKERTLSQSYGGPPKMAMQWALNNCLNMVRRLEGE